MITVCGRFELARSFNGNPVLTHQATDAPVTHIDTDLLQLLSHPWAAIAAQAQARLFLDVGQNDHIRALPAAGGTVPESPQSTRADIYYLTKSINREGPALFFNKPKPHGFWLAKNWVAFF